MKTLFTFVSIALLSVSSVFATDEATVANWQFPIDGWFAGAGSPVEGIAAHPRSVAPVTEIVDFDAASADFDATWATVAGNGNAIANALGNPDSENGPTDFTGAFKVLYDDANIYVLLQFTDYDVTGTESVEFPLAPYFKLDATDRAAGDWWNPQNAWYTRYSQFGANKITCTKDGFSNTNAMMVNFTGAGIGSINWGGTSTTWTDYLFVDDKTAPASKTVKWIVSIGYKALTGEYRPTFTKVDLLKGISFDLKVNDFDPDDAPNVDPTKTDFTPAEYWFSATNNEAYMSTIYAGFLVKDISAATSVNQVKMLDFAKITSTHW